MLKAASQNSDLYEQRIQMRRTVTHIEKEPKRVTAFQHIVVLLPSWGEADSGSTWMQTSAFGKPVTSGNLVYYEQGWTSRV